MLRIPFFRKIFTAAKTPSANESGNRPHGFGYVRVFPLFIGLALCLCPSLQMQGQSTRGIISGIVTDSSGAALAGAHLVLTDTGTGQILNATSRQDGSFSFVDLQVGTYNLRAQAAGFSAQERTGLQLNANESVTANMSMSIASTSTEVVVSSAPAVMDTTTSNLADVIPSSALEDMPVLTRQRGDVGIYGDVYFSPGVSTQGPNGSNPDINGAREMDTMDTMDGMTVMSNATNEGGGPVQPSMEAVQEVHTVLADAPAEFWRAAAITVVSKSGTNQLHGSIFEDYNGSFLNSRTYFSSTVPSRVYNDFGVGVGGPILRDKLFYFADYEGSREAAQNQLVANTPTTAFTTGDFSGISQTLINPYTGQPFQNNQIPSNMISPVAQKLQSILYPAPNYGSPSLLSGNFRGLVRSQTGFTHFDNGDLTLNYDIGSKDTLFLRNSYRVMPFANFHGSLPSVGPFNETRFAPSGVISENHIFSATLDNELRFGYTDMDLSYHPNVAGSTIVSQSGIQGVPTTTPYNAVPNFLISGISPVQVYADTLDHGKDFEWNDNVIWTTDRHIVKFGIDQIFDSYNGYSIPGQIYGTYSFNGAFTGNAYADFLLGLPQQTSLTTPPPVNNLHGILLGVYVEDQYRFNRRLTLNYGVRWEYQGTYKSSNEKLFSFDPKNGDEVVASQAQLSQISPYFPSGIVPLETAAEAGYPASSMVKDQYLNFYPRLGFAYKVRSDGSTVLRGGFGVYGNNVYGSAAVSLSGSGGPFAGSTTSVNKFVNGAPLFSFPKPFLASNAAGTQTATAINPGLTVPYTMQWNLTAEQKIGSSAALNVSFIDTRNTNIVYPDNLDQPSPSTTPFTVSELAYPNYNAVTWAQNGGIQNYSALQISAQKTHGRNLFLNTGFTWARDLTDAADADSFEATAPENRFCLRCEYGNNPLTVKLSWYLNTTYRLPFGRGQVIASNISPWLNQIIGGWSTAWVGIIDSGKYFSPEITSGFDTANTNTSFTQRPDVIGNPHVAHPTISNWFNVNAFAIPGCPVSDPLCKHSTPVNVGRFGNSRPNQLTGPGFVSFNASLMKDFPIGRGEKFFELRITSANVFNHPNFTLPDNSVSDGPGVAGVITGLNNGQQNLLGGREVDFFGRLQF